VKKCVTIKDQSFCKKPILKIHYCEDSFIYINAAVDYVNIKHCVNCTIFIAAVKKVCAVDKCEKLNLTVASNIITIGNTIDSKFYTFSTYEPIMFGDNKSLWMGPNNANYYDLIDKIKKADIPFTTKSLINFSAPLIFHEYWNITNRTVSIEEPKDFGILVLPEEFIPIPENLAQNLHMITTMDKPTLVNKCFENQKGLIIPFLAPQDYKNMVLDKETKMREIKNKISGSGLSKEQLLVLSNAIQGHFKEWLMGKPEMRELLEMVEWIDND
jgi:hypothetical protein